MSRSFRFRLALRFTAAMAAGLLAISAFSLVTIRALLDRELDASIMNVATIQAATLTDAEDGSMHFHEWDLTPEEAVSVRELIRYAQVWSAEGQSLLRSQYMVRDLPLDRAALRVAGEGEVVWQEASYEGGPIRSVYYPLARLGSEHERHVLQVAAPLGPRNAMIRRLTAFAAGLFVLVTVGSFLGSWWLAKHAVRPVHDIIDQAEAIRAGTLKRGISAHADTREYQRLVQVLNSMLDRIEAAFESQRRFTADASHELRSPLTAVRGELELALRRERSPDEYRRVLTSALEEVVRLSRITEDLLTLARSDAGAVPLRLRSVDFREVVERAADRLAPHAATRGVGIDVEAAGATGGRFDADLVGQIAWNLLENAVKFSEPGGRVRARVTGSRADVRLDVEDEGPGIREEVADRLFERFYRQDASRTSHGATAGTGLGLAIVLAITRAHGGRVAAENRPGGGARFTVWLPRAGDGTAPADGPRAPRGREAGAPAAPPTV